MKTIIYEGEIIRGEPDKLIKVFEGIGYAAERENKNPHGAWQIAEHLKRSRNS